MQNLPKKVRSRKLNSRVDLTAMVSVSFLLIIFFMVTRELAKPKIMDLGVPDCIDNDIICSFPHEGENRAITILLGDDDKLVSYMGVLASPMFPAREMKYGKNGIRQELLKRNQLMLEHSSNKGQTRRGVTVIIKPSKKSNYGNLVSILDEMEITGINSYSIVNDFTPEETELLASK